MADAKIKFDGRETPLGAGVTTIGRASDNTAAFPHDSNISRYHAQIEWRDGDFWLIDLDSSNGTTLNGEPVKSEKLLKDGDVIVFGGSSQIEFSLEEAKSEESTTVGDRTPSDASETKSDEFEAEQEAQIAEETQTASKMPMMLAVAGITCGLAVVFVFAAGYFYYMSGSSACEARAVITAPENGELIKDSTDIEVEAENTECVSRAVFVLDDMIIADAETSPYSASIDPSEFPELADGLNHSLRIILEDEEGNPVGQQSEILLAFETLATPTPTPEDTDEPDMKPTPRTEQKQEISLIDVQKMSQNLVKQFPGTFQYRFDKQFLQEVQKKTSEYAKEGYSAHAQQYRDVINVAFVQEQNLDVPLGYLLAMSRSKFDPARQGAEEGLWRMSNEFVTANAYNGLCGTETLSDPSQNCAAKAASVYLKALVIGVFDGDVIYGAATFGMSPQDASVFKSGLPQNRTDFWNVIKQPNQREQVVRFFAAGIVAENPQRFGLKRDVPISTLYRNLIQ
jgi:pSer/pThr/pTyr-binding forkhead associated (FHA) protein